MVVYVAEGAEAESTDDADAKQARGRDEQMGHMETT